MKNILYACWLLSLGVIAFACTDSGQRISEVRGEADEFEQYAKAEFTIELRANWNDPYVSSDVALDMVLQSPSGQDIVLPAFYVSGNSGENSTWKARFMAKEIGKYNYSFKLYEKGELITTSKRRSFVSVESDRKGILSPNDNWTFKYDNGELFRGVGEYICWEARSTDDNRYLKELHQNPRFNYDYLLTSFAENGGNFFRTWMVYWNLPVDWKIVRNTDRYVNSDARLNESGIQRMDELVDLCDSLDIHFMLALETHGGLLDRGWEISSYNVKQGDRKSTRLNSSHVRISYAVFCLKKKKKKSPTNITIILLHFIVIIPMFIVRIDGSAVVGISVTIIHIFNISRAYIISLAISSLSK